jgi:hypothetical protein
VKAALRRKHPIITVPFPLKVDTHAASTSTIPRLAPPSNASRARSLSDSVCDGILVAPQLVKEEAGMNPDNPKGTELAQLASLLHQSTYCRPLT